jgi:hypothetical protein
VSAHNPAACSKVAPLPPNGHELALSPSLAVREGAQAAAYELKFLLTEAEARAVEELARARLVPDPHGDPARGGAYCTTSLYCDTAQLDVFHRRPSYKRRKHRLRRYEDDAQIFLERKTKAGDRVRKQRTPVPDADLALLAHPMSLTDWPGHWFHRHLIRRQLGPVCRIGYKRVALIGAAPEGPMRLTFDRELHGVLTAEWRVDPIGEDLPGHVAFLSDRVICEFKYRACLPALFKRIVETLRLTPQPVSKYRTFLAWREDKRLPFWRDGCWTG